MTPRISLPDLVVVGIAGKAGSGKDTAASAIVHSRGAQRIALADPMKGAFDDLSGITRDRHKELASAGVSLGRAWQLLGTEAREAVPGGSHLWLHVLAAKVFYLAALHPRPCRRFVVPDVRYPEEHATLAAIVRGWGGRYATLLLRRPEAGGPSGDRPASHSSETRTEAIPAEAMYRNDRSIDELRGVAESFFDSVADGVYDPPTARPFPVAEAVTEALSLIDEVAA